jgi:Family of unknown function (DUF6090)
MIKFFRKIRQNLLSEGKTGKYLKYAIGEIILVVIGILIALQINNWNENRKANALAKKYITEIKTDLINDTLTYNSALKRLDKTLEMHKILLNPELTSNISIDSLHSIVSSCFHSIRIYKIDNATYLKLSNTGFLDSGIYTDIFKEINTYYNKEYAAYSEYIKWDVEQSIDMSNPNFLGHYKTSVNLSNYLNDEKSSENFRNFISSNEFINHTWAHYTRKQTVIDRLLYQKKIATELIKKIESELNNK